MPFSPTAYEPFLRYAVQHEDYPGEDFVFVLVKEMPHAVAEEDQKYVGLTDAERKEEKREQLIKVVGMLSVEDPTNFLDFPRDARPLHERMLEYYRSLPSSGLKEVFSDLCGSAWLNAKLRRKPQVYLRPLENNIAERHGDGSSTVGDQPGV